MKHFPLLVLLTATLFACEQTSDLPPEQPVQVATPRPASDLSDPAADIRYGVRSLVEGEFANQLPTSRRNALYIRPVTGGYSASTADAGQLHNDDMLKRRIMEFVLNPKKMPSLAAEMNQAAVFLVDKTEGDTAWRRQALRVVRLAYTAMWDGQSQNRYGKKYHELSTELKQTILDKAPPKINLAGPWIIPPPPPPPPRPVIEREPNG